MRVRMQAEPVDCSNFAPYGIVLHPEMRRSTSSSKKERERSQRHSPSIHSASAARVVGVWSRRGACSGVVLPAAAHVSIMLSRLYAALGVSKKRKAEDVPESKKRQATHLPESPRAVPASPAQIGCIRNFCIQISVRAFGQTCS